MCPVYGFYATFGVYLMKEINEMYADIDKILENRKKKDIDELIKSRGKEDKKEVEVKESVVFDTIQEQIESPMTTIHCKEAIEENELKLVEKNPENYIEINFIKNIRIVDSFYIHSNIKNFYYNTTRYTIDEELIYILPTKKGYFIPTCFFRESFEDPVDFKQKNTGITGKALSLLYDVKLYVDMFSGEDNKYNLFVVLLIIASISCFIIGLYFLLGGTI